MNIENFRNFCISFKGVSEEFPFDKKTLVFKVFGKMFALCDIESFESINLKCNPDKSIELREKFESINPGYHMNKKHWNTVTINSDASDEIIFKLTEHSYDLVFKSLAKKIQEAN